MTSETSLEYLERRAREEADASRVAKSADIASAHRFLATEYQAQANEIRRSQQTVGKEPQQPGHKQNSDASGQQGERER